MKITINKLAEQTGLTSRTLRHWESEGLFQSERNPETGWRMYEEDAVFCIKCTALLRKFDVPLKDIRAVLGNGTYGQLYAVLQKRISNLTKERFANLRQENRLRRFLDILNAQNLVPINDCSLADIETGLMPIEDIIDIAIGEADMKSNFKVVILPPMRVVFHIAVGISPEDEAMEPIFTWIEQSGLKGTARFFGFNVEPWPDGNQPYGFGMCATIPESAVIPAHFQEMRMAGGLYAVVESGDDIADSWKAFFQRMSEDDIYEPDNTRMGLEEHVSVVKADGAGYGFSILLMLPVKNKPKKRAAVRISLKKS